MENTQKHARFFGEPFKEREVKEKPYVDIVRPENNDGSFVINRDHRSYGKINHSNSGIEDFDPNNEAEMIQKYRNISDHPDVAFAVEEIVNEMFFTDGESKPISLNLDNIEDIEDSVKEQIIEEFDYLLGLLNFNRDAFEIFRRFYVDSRIYYYKEVDPAKANEGIKDLKYIDPISIRKIKEVKLKKQNTEDGLIDQVLDTNSYYLYTPKTNAYSKGNSGDGKNSFGSINQETLNNIFKNTNTDSHIIKSYAIAEATSGLYDHNRNCIKGHLHKSIKPLNDVSNLETHMIIYRIARAPERRVFYIDTGALPPKKAQQYINLVQDNYRREVNYDSASGEIESHSKSISMHEDFWLPRSSDGKGTQVDTLSGASNLGELADVEYMNKKFRNSLNVPVGRFDSENPVTMILGGSSENTKDEIKFQKFISRLRSRFNGFLKDILGTQIILKGILSSEHWDDIVNTLTVDYIRDSYLEDLREYAIFQQKIEAAKEADDFVGKYFSREFVWKNIFKFTEEEIEEQKELIKAEKEEYGNEEDF